jgi:hypothetical protein
MDMMQVADSPVAPSPPGPNLSKLAALGGQLRRDFESYERDRRNAEMKWMRNLRQYLGIYDPHIEAQLDNNRSKAYPRLTRVKCVSMLARMMNLLFPTGEKNWGIEPTPVPNLSTDDLARVLEEQVAEAMQDAQEGKPSDDLESEEIEKAIREFAAKRAKNLERELDDQLAEIGGSRMVDYVALCRKVLDSGIKYGIGVLKGPFARTQQQRQWQKIPPLLPEMAPKLIPVTTTTLRPQFEFVPVWDYYPDMSAKYLHQMDGQFQRVVMSRHQLRELADRDDFFSEVILKYLTDNPKGNYKQRTYEVELKGLGIQSNVNDNDGRKYELIVWDGFISGHYLKAAGVELPDDKLGEMIEACVWLLDDFVIKCDMNPWVTVGAEDRVNMYHHFIFEEDDSNLLGNGLPNVMRDSQMGVAASARMVLDNSGVVSGPNLEVNTDLLRPDQDMTGVRPYKIWYREGVGPEAAMPAVKNVQIDSHIDELLKVNELFRQFADTETFINPATGGDMSKGPSEPFRTAAGASMLRGDAALPFKDVVRNFDLFTQSVIASLVAFNKHFNPKPEIQGDFQVVTRGSTSLIAKEVRGIAYDQLAQTLQPEERPYVKWREMLMERLTVRDVDVSRVVVDEDEAKQIDAANAQKAQQQNEQMQELLKAEVRKLLADAVKAITQADKNTAAADAAVYNAILGGLEKGVAPNEVSAARDGAGVPEHIVPEQSGPDGAGDAGTASRPTGNGSKPAAGRGAPRRAGAAR